MDENLDFCFMIKFKDLASIDFTQLFVNNRILWHICFWVFYMSVRIKEYYYTIRYYDNIYLKFMFSYEITFIIIVYTVLFLYNQLIPKKKFIKFIISSVLLWTLYILFQKKLLLFFLGSLPDFANANYLEMSLNGFFDSLIYLLIIIFSKYFKDSFIHYTLEGYKKEQQLQFELQNLKAQISPHFLFNTMNNFYGLAVEKSNKLPNLMIKLSELLRYSLYETNQSLVPLKSEIEYLKNYVELEKIRLEDDVKIEFSTPTLLHSNYQIAPLLLMIFVENAFKHARSTDKNSIEIKIIMKIDHNDFLYLDVQNNYIPNSSIQYNQDQKGLGLANVKKRLDALYPNDFYKLEIHEDGKKFNITLSLKLHKIDYE
jgi:two-component system, LytTR family, sensor histidine kinase LytS